MKSELIWILCEKCGRTFEYAYRGFGKKPSYCPECKVIVKRENVKRYEEKQKENKIEKIKQDNVIIDTNNMKGEKQFLDYTSRALDLLGQLDTLRVNMCNLTQELSEYQSNYDKQDQEFIHKIELNKITNGTEALQFINDWANDRKSRRNVKHLIRLLRDTINVIPLKCKFTAINNISNNNLKENK